ncbi:MAG: TonB-dependent receptor, partial [Gemmatimonadaceae bacterium]
MVSNVRWRIPLLVAAAIAATAPLALRAQGVTGTIEGTVTEQGSGRPLSNAQVFVAGTTVGGQTNGQGVYRITGAPARQVEVRVRLIGFSPTSKSVVVTAGTPAKLDFELSVSALQLEQVVVTGSGAAVEVKKLGNSVATISPPEFAPITSPSQLLTAREPGVVGLPSSGLTGEGTRIRIRGNASLAMSNEPIIFVDGIRINSAGGFGDNVGAGGGGRPSRLDDIDPATIERIEILKGAAAATLYGTEASNGVIQIFTKRGQSGAAKWTFQADQSALRYPGDRVAPNVGFARRAGQADTLSKFYGRTIAPFELISINNTDNLWTTGLGTNLNGSVSGGANSYTYFVSGRYAVEDGPYDQSNPLFGDAQDRNRRSSGLTNLSLVPFSSVRLGFRASYTDAQQQTIQNANNIYGVTSLTLFSKPELANCGASATPGDASYGVSSPGNCKGPGNRFGNAAFATTRETTNIEVQNNAGRFTGVLDATWTPSSNVTWTGTFGLDQTDERSFSFQGFQWNVDKFSGNRVTGSRTIDARTDREYTVDSKLAWKSKLGSRIESDFVVGIQGFISQIRNTGGNGQNFPGPGIEVVEGGSTHTITERFLSTVNGGYFAQEQIGLDNWIYGTIGARYDYSSAFGENSGGVIYPKLSISVVPSDLQRWGSPFGIDTWRVRAAIGQSGRQPGAFDKLTTYGPTVSELGSGLVPLNLGNPDLKPEISTEWELGTEFGLFSNKVGLDFGYWNRTVNDALVAKLFATSGGFRARQLANVGILEAHGIDLSAKWFALQGAQTSVDFFVNGAYIFQNIKSLGGAAPLKVGESYVRYRNFLKEGFGPGTLFGAKLVQPCSARPTGKTYTCLQSGQLPYDLNRDKIPDSEADVLAFVKSLRSANNADPLSRLNPMMVDEDGDGDLLDHLLGK